MGYMERHRSCTDPPPQYGGLGCVIDDDGYDALQNQSCNEHNCSGLVNTFLSKMPITYEIDTIEKQSGEKTVP